MELKTMKTLALTSAVALGVAISGPAKAQVETVTATLITSSAITSNVTTNMDYGTWLIQFVAGDAPVLTMTSSGALGVTQTGTVANGSQVTNIVPAVSQGVVAVQTPAPSNLTMTTSNFVDIADAGLSLDDVAYSTASEAGATITGTVIGAAVPVTVLAAATDENVTFGGNINVTATPADATHTASFDITFSY